MLRLLLLHQFWLAEICICHKPRLTRDDMCDLQIALLRSLTLPFFSIFPALYMWHIRACFELWGRPFCSSLLASFFLPFGVAMKGIQSTQLLSHISFLSFVRITTCFLSSWGRLLDSRKHWLFCQYIQHATHLFEQWTLVSSSGAAVCGFCLSISLHWVI